MDDNNNHPTSLIDYHSKDCPNSHAWPTPRCYNGAAAVCSDNSLSLADGLHNCFLIPQPDLRDVRLLGAVEPHSQAMTDSKFPTNPKQIKLFSYGHLHSCLFNDFNFDFVQKLRGATLVAPLKIFFHIPLIVPEYSSTAFLRLHRKHL